MSNCTKVSGQDRSTTKNPVEDIGPFFNVPPLGLCFFGKARRGGTQKPVAVGPLPPFNPTPFNFSCKQSPVQFSQTSVVFFHDPRNDRHLHSYHLCPGFGFDNVVCLPQKPTFKSAELSCRFPVPLGFFSFACWIQYVLMRGH